jgi:deoxycytidylate deaminase
LVSLRSIDQSTKCGAVIVSKDNRVLSQGYNGPLKNSDDTDFRTDRPYKYYVTLHAEENAILAYNGSYQDIQGSTIFVTGRPCHKCLRMIIQKGISRVVYPKIPLTVLQAKDSMEIESFDDMVNRYNGDFAVDEVDTDVINRISLLYDKCKLAVDERCRGCVFGGIKDE